jgi:hypothetical protein
MAAAARWRWWRPGSVTKAGTAAASPAAISLSCGDPFSTEATIVPAIAARMDRVSWPPLRAWALFLLSVPKEAPLSAAADAGAPVSGVLIAAMTVTSAGRAARRRRVSPMRSSSSGSSSVGWLMRTSLTKVPFAEPRSSTRQVPSGPRRRIAWRRDTVASFRNSAEPPALRPSTTVARFQVSLAPAKGPSTTSTISSRPPLDRVCWSTCITSRPGPHTAPL